MLGKNNVPHRMCIYCRKRMSKNELSRFISCKETKELVYDIDQIKPGRGIYLCKSGSCRDEFFHRLAKGKVKGLKI